MVHKSRLCFLILVQLCICISAETASENRDETGPDKGTCSKDVSSCRPVDDEKHDSAENREQSDGSSQASINIQETAAELGTEKDDSSIRFAHLNESFLGLVDKLTDEVKGNFSDMEAQVMSNRSELLKKMDELSVQSSQNFTSVNESIENNKNKMNELGENLLKSINKINDEISVMKQNEVKNKESLNELKLHFEKLYGELNRTKEELKKDFEDGMEKNMKLLIETKDKLNTDIEGVDTDFKKKLGELRSDHEGELQKIKKIQEEDKEGLDGKIEGSRDELQKKIESAKGMLKSDIMRVEQQLKHLLEDTKSSMEEKYKNMEGKMANVIKDMERKAKELSETLKSTEENLKRTIEETESEMMSNINLAKDDLNKHIESIMATFKVETSIINKTLHIQQGLVDLIYPNTFNKETVLKVAFIIIIVVALNLCCTFALIRSNGHSAIMGAVDNGQRQNSSPSAVLDRVPFQPELENMICLVYFDEDRLELIKKILQPVLQWRNHNSEGRSSELPVKRHVIRSHDDIVNIPPCQLTVMCVDFTERHVIIEQQGIGLGDLKRTTHDAIQKLGSSEVILYMMDPGSRKLSQDHLYNSDIYCVTSQAELVPLEKAGRFYSVYDNLTRHQQMKFRDIILNSGIRYP